LLRTPFLFLDIFCVRNIQVTVNTDTFARNSSLQPLLYHPVELDYRT